MSLPSWTKLSTIEETGRDPLGLERVHERLSEWLMPGITLVTPRARYYSFYLWAVQQTNQLDHPRDRNAFIEGMRRREAAYVLANFADAEQTKTATESLTGTEQGLIKWQQGQRASRLSTKFSPLPSSRLGGYSQYYGGSLYKLGLSYTPAEANGIDQLTAAGTVIANAFDQSIKSTAYRCEHQHDDTLDLSVLTEYGKAAGLDRLKDKKQECLALIDLFFARNQHAVPSADWRKQSLLLCLDVARAAEETGYPLTRLNFEDTILAKAVYYRNLSSSNHLCDYIPPPAIRMSFERYRLFQANRYFMYALECLLWAMIDVLQDEPSGMKVEEYVESLPWPEVERYFLEYSHSRLSPGPGISGWLTAIFKRPLMRLDSASSSHFDEANRGGAKALELVASDALQEAGANESVGLALLIFFSLFCRCHYYHAVNQTAWSEVALHGRGDLWVGDMIHTIEDQLDKDASIKDFLKIVLAQWVVRRHEIVLRQKQKSGAGWLYQDQDRRVHFKQAYIPYMRISRLVNATPILQDVGLLEVREDCLKLTHEGKSVLAHELSRER